VVIVAALAGCGGKSRDNQRAPLASAGGESAGAGAAPGVCSTGDARCNAEGLRESCEADGQWSRTDFVCARTVAVDDEIGSFCVTKTDGSYRCWEGDQTQRLQVERYRRVQLTQSGLIGLTEDGRLLAPTIIQLPALPPAATFRATNMYGGWGVCPLLEDGSFQMLIGRRRIDSSPYTEVRFVDGAFTRAYCAFEGLGAGVRRDGSLWTQYGEVPEGNDFADVAVSLRFLCAITKQGKVTCFEGALSCGAAAESPCVAGDLAAFANGRYHSLSATYAALCAIDENRALVCQRFDGVAMPMGDGRYKFAEGGRNVLCALRVDGTTACFRHGDGFGTGDAVGFFEPVAVDPGW
jgi:hypothetical protein